MVDGKNEFLENYTIPFFGPVSISLEEGYEVENFVLNIFLTISLSLCMILAIVGNACTCVVILRKKNMKTPTNLYLLNLAVTDILMSLFIPIDIHNLWYPGTFLMGDFECRFQYLCWDLLSNCSLLTITSFTIERYLVITKPFLIKTLSTRSRVIKLVTVFWILSFIFCIPMLYNNFSIKKKTFIFCFVRIYESMGFLYGVETILFYVIPMSIVLVLYALLIVKLKNRNERTLNHSGKGQKNKDKAVLMLATVALTFFIFWSPYCCARLLISSRYTTEEYYNVWRFLGYLCFSPYISGALNPILYNAISSKFRNEFKVSLEVKYLNYCSPVGHSPTH